MEIRSLVHLTTAAEVAREQFLDSVAVTEALLNPAAEVLVTVALDYSAAAMVVLGYSAMLVTAVSEAAVPVRAADIVVLALGSLALGAVASVVADIVAVVSAVVDIVVAADTVAVGIVATVPAVVLGYSVALADIFAAVAADFASSFASVLQFDFLMPQTVFHFSNPNFLHAICLIPFCTFPLLGHTLKHYLDSEAMVAADMCPVEWFVALGKVQNFAELDMEAVLLEQLVAVSAGY